MVVKLLVFLFETDINECAVLNGNCSQICTNRNGSYSCSCYAGYQLLADKRSCNGEYLTMFYALKDDISYKQIPMNVHF